MPNIKDLKIRIKSVKSTQKITKAMKMVAAAKLRKAKLQLDATIPYATQMQEIYQNVTKINDRQLSNGEMINSYLLLVATSDRGLCGSFNSSIIKSAKHRIQDLLNSNEKVSIYCIGKKGYEQLKINFSDLIIGKVENLSKKSIIYQDVWQISQTILEKFKNQNFTRCEIIYNKFQSAIAQTVVNQQLLSVDYQDENELFQTDFEYEPNKNAIIKELLPQNFATQLYLSLLDNITSEQGARMTAMDNATNSANEMIKTLTLLFNRTRQATITKELIEIISGAEAI